MQKKTEKIVSLTLKIALLVILTAFSIGAIAHTAEIWGDASIFSKEVTTHAFLQMLYTKLPAAIRTVQIITFAALLTVFFKLITMRTIIKSKRSITIAKLLNSLIRWVIIILAILLILGAWGVDTATLIASAGIMSLVVGLGAQSLIADIIAGLFIVVEGEYQVGDIVVIDDWRGTVIEIGIRTTKIEDAGGNIKIVNNSEIKTIINQTQALSVAKATISIDYAESLPRVELIIRDNLDKIKENVPSIIEGPFYKGVSALSASSVDLLFIAKCNEEDIYQVTRDLNREFKLLFDSNGINIPFPQVVVNQPKASKPSSENVEIEARAFAREQEELSREIASEKEEETV